jgi:hypothetical protein
MVVADNENFILSFVDKVLNIDGKCGVSTFMFCQQVSVYIDIGSLSGTLKEYIMGLG